MKKALFRISIPLLGAFLLSACNLPFIPQKSGVQITSSPQANVFLNDQSFGSTPIIREDLRPGNYKIKIVPNDSTTPPWESNIVLSDNLITVVDRQLSTDSEQSSGYVLSYESLSNKKTSEVSIITTQTNVSVAVDGKPTGFTPQKLDSLEPGSHAFFLSSPGFQEKTIKAQTRAGLRLVINAQLATQAIIPTPTPELTPAPTASPSGKLTPSPTISITTSPKQSTSSAVPKPYVEILSTPTGWLKVRATGDAQGAELTKVNPGDKFPYLDSNAGGWLQIEYTTGKTGWVSATYAKVVK